MTFDPAKFLEETAPVASDSGFDPAKFIAETSPETPSEAPEPKASGLMGPPEPTDLSYRMMRNENAMKQRIRGRAEKTISGEQSWVSGALQSTGDVAQATIQNIGETLPESVRKFGEGLGKKYAAAGEAAGKSTAGFGYSPYPGMTPETIPNNVFEPLKPEKTFSEAHPTTSANLAAAGSIAGLATLPLSAPGALSGAGRFVEDAATLGKDLLNPTSSLHISRAERAFNRSAEEASLRGTKPTDRGARTLDAAQKYDKNYKDALQTIAEYSDKIDPVTGKKAINIVDKEGNNISIPSTHHEAAQAIDDAKLAVFKDYTDYEKTSGNAGSVMTPEHFKGVDAAVNNVTVENGFTKKDIAYAKDKLAEYQDMLGQSPETVSKRLKIINNDLQGAYNDPTRTSTHKAIDMAMATELREALDDIITKGTDPRYKELRRKYGALKSVERDINHRAKVLARKSDYGVFALTDILTNGEIGHGLLTANPAIFAKGLIGKATKKLIEHHNNPDRYLSDAFKKAYRLDKLKKEAMGIPSSTGAANAETLRGNQEVNAEKGPLNQGSQGLSSKDIQREQKAGGTESTPQKEKDTHNRPSNEVKPGRYSLKDALKDAVEETAPEVKATAKPEVIVPKSEAATPKPDIESMIAASVKEAKGANNPDAAARALFNKLKASGIKINRAEFWRKWKITRSKFEK